MNQATSIISALEGRHVMVVGDVMLDRYLRGAVSRISPEAPVPVVLHQQTEDRLGGAANVALNLHALGGIPILCSIVGNDPDGHALRERILPEAGISGAGIFFSNERVTTVKTRVLGNQQQMLRIDHENTHDLSAAETDQLLGGILHLLDQHNIRVLVFQDYNKGVLTPQLVQRLIEETRKRGILTAVDPKKANFFTYEQVDLFKPNLKEIRDSAPFSVQAERASLDQAAYFLQNSIKNKVTMITLSEKGIYLKVESSPSAIYPTVPRSISDVSGAGDTVISVAALGMAAGLEWPVIAVLSNLAGGQVCESPGVVPVNKAILQAELEHWIHQNKLP
jgi:D-glycero-beta-D-manno-heptose-7-phosphate kinase